MRPKYANARKQKTDPQDAQHILNLLLKNDFPPIWVLSWENRDLRQLLWHRHRNGASAHPHPESICKRVTVFRGRGKALVSEGELLMPHAHSVCVDPDTHLV